MITKNNAAAPSTFEQDGITATAQTGVIFTLTDSEMASIADEDREEITYGRLTGYSADSGATTETVTAHVLKQTAGVIDRYRDRLLRKIDGYKNPAVPVTQLVSVEYPSGRSDDAAVIGGLDALIAAHGGGTGAQTEPSRFSSNLVLGEKAQKALAAGAPLSAVLATFTAAGLYLSKVRSVDVEDTFSPAFSAEIDRLTANGDQAEADARIARWAAEHANVNPSDGSAILSNGRPVYSGTSCRIFAGEGLPAPVRHLDFTAGTPASLASLGVDLAVSGDGLVAV